MERFAAILRWTARGSAIALAALWLLFAAGEVLFPHANGSPTGAEWVGIALMAVACLAPLLGWKWEPSGGLLSLGCLAGWVTRVRIHNYGVVFVVAIPGVLLLASWGVHRLERRSLPPP